MTQHLIKQLCGAFIAALILLPGPFEQASFAQVTPTPETPGTENRIDLPPESLDISNEGLFAMKQYLVEEEKRVKVISLRGLLEERVAQTLVRGRPSEHGAAMILQAVGAFEPAEWDKMLKALDQIWAIPADYYDLLSDASLSVERYRSWLGSERYKILAGFSEFLASYRDSFIAWRIAQPPRPWRSAAANTGVVEQEERTPLILRPTQGTSASYQPRNAPRHIRQSIPRYRMRGPALSTRPYWPNEWRRGDAAVEPRRTSPRVTQGQWGPARVEPLFVP